MNVVSGLVAQCKNQALFLARLARMFFLLEWGSHSNSSYLWMQ